MYIGKLRTQSHSQDLKTESFMEAWNFLHDTAKFLNEPIIYGAVHIDSLWHDGHYLHQSKEVAVMRKIK